MQTAKNYLPNATANMERALRHMPVVTAVAKPLPSTQQEITRYVELLLTPDEQQICNMATD